MAVVGYGRPEYFQQSLTAAMRSRGVEFTPFVFVDGGLDNKASDYISIAEQNGIPLNRIFVQPYNLGVGKHMIFVRDFILKHHRFEQMIMVEEDVVLQPYGARLMEVMADWSRNVSMNVGVTSVWAENYDAPELKLLDVHKVRSSLFSWRTYLMKRWCWYAISPFMYKYRDNFLDKGKYSERPNEQIREFVRLQHQPAIKENEIPVNYNLEDRKTDPRFPTSQDSMMEVAMATFNIAKIHSVVNRCVYIGREGEHSNSAQFEASGFHNMFNDEFLIDETITPNDLQFLK